MKQNRRKVASEMIEQRSRESEGLNMHADFDIDFDVVDDVKCHTTPKSNGSIFSIYAF